MSGKLLAPIVLMPFLLAACGNGGNNSDADSTVDDYEATAAEAESTEGDFIYRLVTEQSEYAEGEAVRLYSELEYIGEEERIEIYHAASPFFFPMEEKTRDYTVDFFMNQPLLNTTLIKGEPLREEFSGGGGYGEEEKENYKDFIRSIMNGHFPEGFYEVKGYSSFFTETQDGSQTDYEIHAEVNFKVVK